MTAATPQPEHRRVPWVVMSLALALLLSGSLAACRVGSSHRAAPRPVDAEPVRSTHEPLLRVRMLRSTGKLELRAPGTIAATPEGERGPSWMGQGPLTITLGDSGFVMGSASATIETRRLRLSTGRRGFEIGPKDSGTVLLGELELIARSESPGRFDVIESVPIERYLPGVLAKELYPNFHEQAYEAQAIAARTYAMHERERRMRIGSAFDVESSTKDQAYGGATAHPRALEAVKNTRGQVLTWEGDLLRAYYSSTCGDRAASAGDTWPVGAGFEFNSAGPIQSHDRVCACSDSPRHRWSVSRGAYDVTQRMRAWGQRAGHSIRGMSRVRSVDVLKRNEMGRPSRYRVRDDRGKAYELSAEQLRVSFNVERRDGKKITSKERVLSGDIRVDVRGDTVHVTGRGFGHGVGLCQFGAHGLAKQGLGARSILRRYYPGAKVERAY